MTARHSQTTALMRFALILGAVLTLLCGIQLFALTGHTADFFAWTIGAGALTCRHDVLSR